MDSANRRINGFCFTRPGWAMVWDGKNAPYNLYEQSPISWIHPGRRSPEYQCWAAVSFREMIQASDFDWDFGIDDQ